MESRNSLIGALITQYPDRRDQILEIYQKHHETAKQFLNLEDLKEDAQDTYSFPLFSQLTEQFRRMLGNSEFRSFMDNYIKTPQYSQKLKEELHRLEKEVLNLESRENLKVENLGQPIYIDSTQAQVFCYSSLSNDMEEEFKDAKWVVLTQPNLSKNIPKSPALPKEVVQTNNSSTNIALTLTSTNSSTNRLQTSNSNSNQGSALNQQKQANLVPQKRYGHSASLVKNKMYIFGGLASHQKGGNHQTFYECQLKLNNDNSGVLFQWDRIKADAPRARDSHTCVHVGDALIMFGGSGGASSFNDLYKFDLRQQKWSKLEPLGDHPAPREGHIAKLVGRDRMLIHGGVDQKETSFDDTYILTGISQFMDSSQQISIIQSEMMKSATPFQFFDNQMQIGSYDTNASIHNASVQKNQFGTPNAIAGKLRWYKCIQRGNFPKGRDSHSSAQINNKIYIFGGQGDGDAIFDDLYSVEIIEEQRKDGELQFVAQWELIEQQTPKGQKSLLKKPCARTSHACTVYKNRFMIIIGGETEIEPGQQKIQLSLSNQPSSKQKQKNEEIYIDIDNDSLSEENDKNQKDSDQNDKEEQSQPQSNKKILNDVWVYDTLMQKWLELNPPFKLQGASQGKKSKREFEPRMAHSAVSFNQFVVLFGGLSTDSQLVSNDLYLLCLDGNLCGLDQAFDQFSEQKHQIQAPEVNIFERIQNAPNSKPKISKTLKITSQQDRKIMTGQILNQIINFNTSSTNQFYYGGNQLPNSNNIFTPNMNQSDFFNGQRMVIKNDIQIQTVDLQSEIQNRELDQKHQLITILKQNEYKMKNFQRTKVSFIRNMSQEILWPFQCFGAFIDNSIQAFEFAKFKLEATKQQHQQNAFSNFQQFNSANNKMGSLEIEINMKSSQRSSKQQDIPNFNADTYLEIKDNGPGLHPKVLMEALTSFGSSNILKFKSDYNLSEHGLSLKLNSLRLASNILIISKTKPIYEYGSAISYISISLFSLRFLKESSSSYLIAPLVALEMKNKRISKHLTPQSDHFLSIIANYTKPRFETGEQIQTYAMNVMGDYGTHMFFFDLQKQKQDKTYESELGYTSNDIVLNPQLFNYKEGLIESSLRTYLKFLNIEYPDYVKIFINGHEADLKNPYSVLKKEHPSAFVGEKTDKFAVQLLDEKLLEQDQQQSKPINESSSNQMMKLNNSEPSLIGLQGILVYRGNRLIRRLETVFGDDEDDVIRQLTQEVEANNKGRVPMFKKNAIVSVFKSRSSTQLDKTDFSEKVIMKRVKEWFKARANN